MDYSVLSLFCQNLDRSLTYLFVSPVRLLVNKQETLKSNDFHQQTIHQILKNEIPETIKSNYISIYFDSKLYR